ncbi:hypothetical protein LCGC14_3149470 [marine sediment metagenome]|uniref:Uncharacterized protein n=1 Tax=marine sediment metagenome TaxID=412755 RepID=A0A0F8VUL9_9ZZZZ
MKATKRSPSHDPDPQDAKALMGQRSDRALAIYTHPLERQRLLVEAVGERLMETTEVVQ